MLKIVFDATVLVDGNDMKEERRGIYFVAKNILREMSRRDDVEIILYASSYKIAGLERVNKEMQLDACFYRKIPFFSRLFHKFITYLCRKRFINYQRPIIRKAFALAILLSSSFCDAIFFVLNSFYKTEDAKTFFSTRTAAPRFINRDKSIKKFIVIYDLIPYVLPEYAGYRSAGWFGHLIRHLNETDYYFAISEATKKDFCTFSRSIIPSHVSISYLAVDDSFNANKGNTPLGVVAKKYGIPAKKYVMALGSLEPRKNLLRIVRTFLTFVKENNIDDLILVIGGGEWLNFKKIIAKQLDASLSIEKYVFHIGYVNDGDLPVLYSNAEWFVYTSQYEGFGLPPLEAMQCGCPVIASNNSSLPEVVGDAGVMIDWDDDEQHLTAYEKFFFDEELRRDYGRKGVERAKLFSWAKTANKMIDTMKRVV